MKILLDGRLISEEKTGISIYSEEILNIYISLFGKENIALIINSDLKKNYDDITVYRTRLKPFNFVHFIYFYRKLKLLQYDIYHSPFYSNSFFKDNRKIYITTVHDLMYRVVPDFFSKIFILNKLGRFYYDLIVKRSLNNTNYILTISEASKKDIKYLFGLESYLITEGVNFLDSDEEIISIDLEKYKYFLYVGNNRLHKNIEFLLDCYMKSKTNKKLVLVGHSGESKYIGNKGIVYKGYVNDATLNFLYKNAAAFIFPSLYEGFGLPILEAINSDTIVLSSNAGALSEFGNCNIYYFNPHKKEELITLIDTIDKYEFDEQKKTLLLSKFSWRKTKIQLREFLITNNILKD